MGNENRIDDIIANKVKREIRKGSIRGFFLQLIIWLIVFYIFLGVIGGVSTVSGESMEPELYSGDVIVYFKLGSEYRIGDVVVFSDGSKDLVKRVIAVGGDTVDIDSSGMVSVNGEPLKEDYIYTKTYAKEEGTQFPLEIPEGSVFVLGDNRTVSRDSRSSEIGLLENKTIIGKGILFFRLHK